MSPQDGVPLWWAGRSYSSTDADKGDHAMDVSRDDAEIIANDAKYHPGDYNLNDFDRLRCTGCDDKTLSLRQFGPPYRPCIRCGAQRGRE